jgi:hypothetical protein
MAKISITDQVARPPKRTSARESPFSNKWLMPQRATPVVNMAYIPREMARVSRVRKVCSTCGTKEAVVSRAAMDPMASEIGDMDWL